MVLGRDHVVPILNISCLHAKPLAQNTSNVPGFSWILWPALSSATLNSNLTVKSQLQMKDFRVFQRLPLQDSPMTFILLCSVTSESPLVAATPLLPQNSIQAPIWCSTLSLIFSTFSLYSFPYNLHFYSSYCLGRGYPPCDAWRLFLDSLEFIGIWKLNLG